MNVEDIIIGVHGQNGLKYGQYDVLSSFGDGLLKAFQKLGTNAYWTAECFEKNLIPTFTIGFNLALKEIWEPLLNSNIPNIMWNVDSIFTLNFRYIEKYQQYKNFIAFSITNGDQDPVNDFYPELNFAYVAHATDPELWKKPNNDEKEIDMVLLSSFRDYKQMLKELKLKVNKQTFDMMMSMYEISMKNPHIQFYDVYKEIIDKRMIAANAAQYAALMNELGYIIMYAKKSQVVESLSDYNLKIYGHGPWENVVSGKIEYCGTCNLAESINIMNKSKIVLHPHYPAYEYGLHERILNASALETFVLSSEATYIKGAFKDSIGFYDNSNFGDLHEKVDYYLKNPDIRTDMAKKAREIVLKDHTWDVRAKQILQLLGLN